MKLSLTTPLPTIDHVSPLPNYFFLRVCLCVCEKVSAIKDGIQTLYNSQQSEIKMIKKHEQSCKKKKEAAYIIVFKYFEITNL